MFAVKTTRFSIIYKRLLMFSGRHHNSPNFLQEEESAVQVRQGFWKLAFVRETFTKLETFHKFLEAFVQFLKIFNFVFERFLKFWGETVEFGF